MKDFSTTQGWEQWGLRALVVLLYVVMAVIVAVWIGSYQVRLLLGCVFAAILGVVVFGLQRRAWVLIPLAWIWTGYTVVMPLPFSIRDTAILLAASAYVGYRIVGHHAAPLRMTVLDWLLWTNIFYLGITYGVNPVGFGIFGSETVGGRPYVTIALAVVAYQVLIRAPNSLESASRVPLYLLVSAGGYSFMFLLTYLAPSLPGKLPWLFAALDTSVFSAHTTTYAAIPRYQQFSELGLALSLVLCSYYAPRTLFNPARWRFWFFLIALACILAAGFRSLMLWVLVAIVLGSWLHRGGREVLLVSLCAVVFFGLVLAGQGRLYELPRPAQRSLAFLPGKWTSDVVDDVRTSSEGRFQWWRDIVKYRMIRNWWVGDGFGASAAELEAITARGTFTEFMTATGGYHNGPLSAIRYAGVIGLGLLYALMITTAILAVRYAQRTRGSPLFPLAVFIAIQVIWFPVHYTFVFGGYDSQLPRQIFLAALLRLLIRMTERNLGAAVVVPATSATRPVALTKSA